MLTTKADCSRLRQARMPGKQDAVDHQRLAGKTAQKPAQAQGNHPTYGQAHKGQGPKASGNTTEPHAKRCNGTATRKQQQ